MKTTTAKLMISPLASEIYQAAKKVANGVWEWRNEWSKAMKAGWKQVLKNLNTLKAMVMVQAEIVLEGTERQVAFAKKLISEARKIQPVTRKEKRAAQRTAETIDKIVSALPFAGPLIGIFKNVDHYELFRIGEIFEEEVVKNNKSELFAAKSVYKIYSI